MAGVTAVPMHDLIRVPDYVWTQLEPTLQALVDAAHEQIPSAGSLIERLPLPNGRLAAYASFVKPIELIRDDGDVIVSIECSPQAKGLRCGSDVAFNLDPTDLLEGPAVYLQSGLDPDLMRSQIDAWIADTNRFIRASGGRIIERLRRDVDPGMGGITGGQCPSPV
jgi:hypothetical protein